MYKFLISVFVLFAISCKHEPLFPKVPAEPNDTITNPPTGKPCNPDTVYFQNDILPLILGNCGIAGCHDAGTAEDGVILIDYNSIMNHGDVTPGNPGKSDLYEVITENDPDKRMPPPPSSALTAAQIALISTWIQQGAQNNYCDGCDTVDVKFASHVLPIFVQSCNGCHGNTPSGGATTSLTNHAQIVTGVTTNDLLARIQHTATYSAMPYGGSKLPDCKIRTVEMWIDLGMKND